MTLLFEPFAPLYELSRELDRLLPSRDGTVALRSFVPPADVLVTDDEVRVVMDLPGFTHSDIEAELVGDTLTVRGERRFPYSVTDDESGPAWQRLERGFGRFERVLRVPEGLDSGAIRASLADGVLTLSIPVHEARRPRRIAIDAGESPPAISEVAAKEDAPADERALTGTAG